MQLEWKFQCAIQIKHVHRGSKIHLHRISHHTRTWTALPWFWDLTIHLYGRPWDIHGGWNQPGTVLSAEHPLIWEQIPLQLRSWVKGVESDWQSDCNP
jgi:hypothetical protein